MSRAAALRARRENLLLQTALLRERMVTHGHDLQIAMAPIDRVIGMARSIHAPPVMAAGAGLLFSIGPGRIFSWVSRGLFVASLARRAYSMIASRRKPKAVQWLKRLPRLGRGKSR